MKPETQENFLTCFKIGYFRSAPGTWGSAIGALAGIPILYFGSFSLFLLTVLVGIIAIREINLYEASTQTHDSEHIVIDEIIGIWTAMCIAQFGILNIILSFVFFRVFDIWKPSVIGRIDKEIDGGLGVVGDDILAGFFAGLASLMIITVLNLFGFNTGFN